MVKIDDQIPVYTAGTGGHLIVCLHGAGHSALSFAALAEKLKPVNTVIAFDFRGHGQHFAENEADLSQAELMDETLRVLNYVEQTHKNRSIVLLGHSMGGSIACKVVHKIEKEMKDHVLCKALVALFVIDVVEGTAMEALPFMEQIVHNRPSEFPDVVSVIKYGVQSGQVRDKRSARVSMPA
jgi:protein phosphatase methylesterase 1